MATECVLLTSWWAQGVEMFCGLVHMVMKGWVCLEPAHKATCLPLLSIMIKSGECWAVGCGLGGSGRADNGKEISLFQMSISFKASN